MFRAILRTQWKGTRLLVLLATIIAFALPLASLRDASDSASLLQFIFAMQRWAAWYAVLAAGVGLLVALVAWQPDHSGRHVYALSLPVRRSRYVLLRLGAGSLFLVPPVLGLLAGALLVAASSTIPDGLHAYPAALTLRFALAAAVAYSLFFAIAASTSQTAGVVLGLVAAVLFAQYSLALLGSSQNVLAPILDFVFFRPGLLSIFAGRWMLVDA